MGTEKKHTSFWSFYPYYLTEHSDAKNRSLHFVGTALIIGFLIAGIILKKWQLIVAIPFCGYGFAWVGHFFIEKNEFTAMHSPVTFLFQEKLLIIYANIRV